MFQVSTKNKPLPLESQVRSIKNEKEIIGQFSEMQNQQKIYNLQPTVKIEMPN
jgi:hypothetical protein